MGAVEFYSAGGGVRWIYSDVENAAPDPILFEAQLGLSVLELKGFFLRPTLGYYATPYEWRDSFALPSEPYILGSSKIHTLTINPVAGYGWPLGPGSLSYELYPQFLVRIPSGGGDSEEFSSFFWSKYRYIGLESGVSYAWEFANGLTMGIRLHSQYPLSNLWDSKAPSMVHGVSVSSGIFFRFSRVLWGKPYGKQNTPGEGEVSESDQEESNQEESAGE